MNENRLAEKRFSEKLKKDKKQSRIINQKHKKNNIKKVRKKEGNY